MRLRCILWILAAKMSCKCIKASIPYRSSPSLDHTLRSVLRLQNTHSFPPIHLQTRNHLHPLAYTPTHPYREMPTTITGKDTRGLMRSFPNSVGSRSQVDTLSQILGFCYSTGAADPDLRKRLEAFPTILPSVCAVMSCRTIRFFERAAWSHSFVSVCLP